MPRCGCASGAQVQIRGEDPVLVTGGSPITGYEVSLVHGGFSGCQAVTACVCESTGRGLACNTAADDIEIQAQISADAGNAIRFGSDGGLMAEGVSEPGTSCAQKTVASLAALPAGTLVVAAKRGAGLVQPFNSPHAASYCLDHNIDIMHMVVSSTSDGIPFCMDVGLDTFPETSNVQAQRWTKFYTSDQLRRITVFAGSLETPAITIPDSFVVPPDRDGGWWGSYAEPYKFPSLGDLLDRIDGKMVMLADCNFGNASEEARNAAAAARAGDKYCAQDWLMIGIRNTSNATAVINAGYTPVMIDDTHAGYGETELPWPIADLQAAGVEWVCTDRNHADSVNTTYRDAGFHVLRDYIDRHVDRTHTETLGVRGFLSHDPVYASGPGREEYRTPFDPWRDGQQGVGAVSAQTNRGIILLNGDLSGGLVGRRSRGFVERTDQTLVIPEGFGSSQGRPTILGGWTCPLANPNEYVIQWKMRADQTPPWSKYVAKMGLLFASPDDDDAFDWPAGSFYPERPRHYYRAYQRYSGEIGIGLFRPDGTFWYLNGDTISAEASGVEVDSPELANGFFNTYRLTVTPTVIEFRRTTIGGTTYSVTANNTEFRGPYFYVEKEESFIDDSGTQNPANPFRGSFSGMSVESVPGA